MKASDLIVRCLEVEGIEFVFGVPGEENADFLLSLDDSSIPFILTRHEQGAAFMAEVYGRLTGNPAVALGTLGPGATNLLTGVADANMDRAPLLVITGQGETTRQHKESHQVIDTAALYEPVTKWSHAIRQPGNIPEVIRKAVRLARMEKPGAVHLELAEDIAKADTDAQPMPVRRFRRPAPDAIALGQAMALLREARHPVILSGNGTIRKRASRELRRFAELTGIGVINTFMAKGCVDRDADYCLFTIGLQKRDHVACAIEASDLVVTVGYDMVEYPPQIWNAVGERSILHIDFIPAEIDSHYHPQVEIVADLAAALTALSDRVEADGLPEYDLHHQRLARARMIAEFAEFKDDETEGRIRPQKVLWDVRQAMGPHDILLSDVGAHKMWIGRYYQCHEPNTCLISNGFASMGFALPGAVAAHLVHPDRHVLAICGDGGFLMNVQEMETARRLNANITVMVWEDHDYGLITWKQQDQFGRHVDMTFDNPDWLQLAGAFGWQGQYVANSRDLSGAILSALEHQGPSLIALPIDAGENRRLSERLGRIACPI